MKGVMRFGKNGNLSPQYMGPYRISKRIGNGAYELELPPELAAVHPVFHISMLKKYMRDTSLIIPTEDISIKDSLSYEEVLVQILDRQVRKLRTKEVASSQSSVGKSGLEKREGSSRFVKNVQELLVDFVGGDPYKVPTDDLVDLLNSRIDFYPIG
ncbi:hypothetical protein MTR67_042615 [Solanum verrucosum]|uniref:Tf2-1-like SH3-like domain-containing protein n=1 Tax=Solanum verrucosum TaxID=315347 RepID=A0AAF0UNT1_SOLVR|nr:hypothetical protein MTR67_042615 [Solanum verrucosum]